MENMPNTQDVQEAARKMRQDNQRQRQQRGGNRSSGGGFDPSDLPEAPPETGPALYHGLFQGDDDEYEEISSNISAGNLDQSEIKLLREKERSIAMLSEYEERYNVDLDNPKQRLSREISFIGQSSKGKGMALVRAMNRQEHVQHQEQMHTQNTGQQAGPGMMQKLKKLFGGRRRRGGGRPGDYIADPGDFNGLGGMQQDGRRDDIW